LIVRELLFGPRRFKDIAQSLPGIGTNLLASRLKRLENVGVLRKRTLPPPAGSAVYELTDRGQELGPAVEALANWGLTLMKNAAEDEFVGVVPLMGSLVLLFNRDSDATPLAGELHVSDEIVHVSTQGREITVAPGPADAAEVVLAGEPKTIIRLLGNPDSIHEAVLSGRLSVVKGDIETARRLVSRFHSLEGVATAATG
jgi:DNA-binding HxlR family transcriptional regulator